MPLLALKIDVDTFRGTREGVPVLLEVLRRRNAGATFLFSLGPDRTGRAIRRVLRPGFLSKVSRTSVLEHYGLRTLLYGTLLPGPDIGRRCAPVLREVAARGFETGIHCWDHVRWQDFVGRREADWTRREMAAAVDRYTEVFGCAPLTHGAAGWQMNAHAYRLEQALGFDYASDGRGSHPFQPALDGRPIGVPQLPTTLPTFDELIGINGVTATTVDAPLLALTAADPGRDQVFTLHAELEGMKLAGVFERLIAGWQAQGFELVSTRRLFQTLPQQLPLHEVVMGEIPGRSGLLALQGPAVGVPA
ncbi:MAG TPA: polysaccharide deacetylase family protein [Burkholderiaceae bacterium]|jgi:peptidoglycan/xylan/chitin deacetylase (PgdA/CDA1 family)|nr:polysaccharide deacetylase family protein [Burkholderiaceae bacterium]